MKARNKQLEKAAFILRTIAHPTRLAIIGLLHEEGALSVSEICSRVDCEQSLLSHHLSNMRLKGLLSARRKGTQVLYTLKEKQLVSILDCIGRCNCYMS